MLTRDAISIKLRGDDGLAGISDRPLRCKVLAPEFDMPYAKATFFLWMRELLSDILSSRKRSKR
jgi:hypothetical protein